MPQSADVPREAGSLCLCQRGSVCSAVLWNVAGTALLLGCDVTEHVRRVRQRVADGGELGHLRFQFVDLRSQTAVLSSPPSCLIRLSPGPLCIEVMSVSNYHLPHRALSGHVPGS